MKWVRKRNPLVFDLILFLSFTLASFAALLLTNAAGVTGAIVSIGFLVLICSALILSR